MKVPLSWLRDYIELDDLSVEDLADRMTFAGIEIEGIERHGEVPDGVVVGEVVACERIPKSRHLHLCRVFDGEETLDVVCGAPNCATGIKAPLARVGTVLPGDFEITRRKLMGRYESFGMLCSAVELGLGADDSGLMLLDAAAPAGASLRDLLGEPEVVFDVEITWNRADMLSILGVAREFAALLGRPLKLPDADFPEEGPDVAELARVAVEDTEGCPRYTARVLEGLKLGPSPDWMRRRLELCGQRPIDIVVDVSNYVMLECGQPLHTFDYERLAGREIIVRRAREGERLETLDEQPRELDPSLLVIADGEKAVAVAGVMGGAGSEISEGTSRVLLESATFAAPLVKRGATRLGMRTESSHRFERGVDPELADWASRRAASLLVRYAGATVARGVIDADSRPAERAPVSLRFERVRQVVGVPLGSDEIIEPLLSLGMELVGETGEGATFAPPSYRMDIVHEADLIEEVARLHGLDALPDSPPAARVAPGADDTAFRALTRCRQVLVDLGLREIMNYSFLSEGELDAFSRAGAGRRLVLPNPVSADFAVMRDSLLPQLLGALGRNAARQTEVAAVFELGRVFFRDERRVVGEEDRLAIGLLGPVGRAATDRVRAVEPGESLLWLKGILESLAEALHAPEISFRGVDGEGFEPGFRAVIEVAGAPRGVMGLADEKQRRRWRVSSPIALLEISRDALLGEVFRAPVAENVPAFPATFRDIALLADAGVTHETLVGAMRSAAPPELVEIELFDIFEGKSIGEGRRSLAYSLEYRSPERTLRDEEANAFHEAIKDALRKLAGVEIRDSL